MRSAYDDVITEEIDDDTDTERTLVARGMTEAKDVGTFTLVLCCRWTERRLDVVEGKELAKTDLSVAGVDPEWSVRDVTSVSSEEVDQLVGIGDPL